MDGAEEITARAPEQVHPWDNRTHRVCNLVLRLHSVFVHKNVRVGKRLNPSRKVQHAELCRRTEQTGCGILLPNTEEGVVQAGVGDRSSAQQYSHVFSKLRPQQTGAFLHIHREAVAVTAVITK